MVKIKTELEQKIELMDSLKNVKKAVNEAGGDITEDTHYLQYGEKVSNVVGLKFLKMLDTSSAEVTGDNTFTITFPKELPDLSVETYVATFTFDNGVLSATATKDGKDAGGVGVYVQLVPYDTSVSTFQKIPALTLSDDKYVCQIGEYTCSFDISIEEGAVSLFGEYSKDGETYGDCDIYWELKEPAPTPVQKGSFDSTTQQLTFNYDYLVEMINSSTMLTGEQKTNQIALLNNSDIVINMASEPETMPENSYVYGFVMTAGGTGIGESYVDKQNSVTLKLAATPESTGVLGSYEAIAGFFSELSGQPTTPEMVEAQYGQFIVDENLCTVSGTIGNFSVEFN